jgi:hypothetical protein
LAGAAHEPFEQSDLQALHSDLLLLVRRQNKALRPPEGQ